MNLTEFLTARIAEREQLWASATSASIAFAPGAEVPDILSSDYAQQMRAEYAAMRRIVELHRPSYDTPGPEFDPYCEGCWEAGGMDGAPTHPCPTVRLVALPYADHADYQENWRP